MASSRGVSLASVGSAGAPPQAHALPASSCCHLFAPQPGSAAAFRRLVTSDAPVADFISACGAVRGGESLPRAQAVRTFLSAAALHAASEPAAAAACSALYRVACDDAGRRAALGSAPFLLRCAAEHPRSARVRVASWRALAALALSTAGESAAVEAGAHHAAATALADVSAPPQVLTAVASALRNLCGSPATQAAAAEAGVLPVLVKAIAALSERATPPTQEQPPPHEVEARCAQREAALVACLRALRNACALPANKLSAASNGGWLTLLRVVRSTPVPLSAPTTPTGGPGLVRQLSSSPPLLPSPPCAAPSAAVAAAGFDALWALAGAAQNKTLLAAGGVLDAGVAALKAHPGDPAVVDAVLGCVLSVAWSNVAFKAKARDSGILELAERAAPHAAAADVGAPGGGGGGGGDAAAVRGEGGAGGEASDAAAAGARAARLEAASARLADTTDPFGDAFMPGL